jgi:hypothetical protein
VVKQTTLVVLALAAVGFGMTRAVRLGQTGEAAVKVWFYDESEGRLYAVPNDTIPPHRGIGGRAGDGVRAVVITFRQEQGNPARRRIAYLETYGPELKQVLEEVGAARRAGRRYDGDLPGRGSPFMETNTLVRRVNELTWHPSSSEEGRRIASEWRGWMGPDEEFGTISVP